MREHHTIEHKPNIQENHWHILGAGAMGCLWAARIWQYAQLSEHTSAVQAATLLLRDEAAFARWQRLEGVLIISNGSETLVPVAASTIANAPGLIDNLLICTKAQDALLALRSVAHLLHANSRVLLLQNGIKAQITIAERFPELALYCLSTSHGAYLRSDYNVVDAGLGQSYLGSLHPEHLFSGEDASALLNALPSESMNISWDSDITGRLWTKFAVNCAINALTVIYDCRNGELLTRPEATAHLRALCVEIEGIMGTIAACPHPLTLLKRVETVLVATAQNYSSTLQDVRNARPTEIAYFNGYLSELAQLAELDCPLNEAVLHSFNAITHPDID